MSLYTIAKTLVFSLGALSAVAHSLPSQQSEINIRAAGGYGFRNPLKKLDNADVNVTKAMSEATTLAATTGQQFDMSTPSH